MKTLVFTLAILGFQSFAQAAPTQSTCAEPALACVASPEIYSKLVSISQSIRQISPSQRAQLAEVLGLQFKGSSLSDAQVKSHLLIYTAKTCGSQEVVSTQANLIESVIKNILKSY